MCTDQDTSSPAHRCAILRTRAGPRETLHFDPHDPASAAAIVSCGGICPGLNCVIREIVNMLWAYGVRRIYGIKGGYKGVMEPEEWLELTPEKVKDSHGAQSMKSEALMDGLDPGRKRKKRATAQCLMIFEHSLRSLTSSSTTDRWASFASLLTMAFWRGTPSWEISTRVSPHLVLFARNLCKNAFKLMSR
eukprot:g24828.t1